MVIIKLAKVTMFRKPNNMGTLPSSCQTSSFCFSNSVLKEPSSNERVDQNVNITARLRRIKRDDAEARMKTNQSVIGRDPLVWIVILALKTDQSKSPFYSNLRYNECIISFISAQSNK